MAKGKTSTTTQHQATPQGVPSQDQSITRVRAALQFIADGADEISENGNGEMPGFVALGFAEVMRWASRKLEEVQRTTS